MGQILSTGQSLLTSESGPPKQQNNFCIVRCNNNSNDSSDKDDDMTIASIEYLLCDGTCTKYITCIISFNPHKSSMRYTLLLVTYY